MTLTLKKAILLVFLALLFAASFEQNAKGLFSVVENDPTYNSLSERPNLVPTSVTPSEACKGNPPQTITRLALSNSACTITMEVTNLDLTQFPENATIIAVWTVTGPDITGNGGNAVSGTVNLTHANPPDPTHPAMPASFDNMQSPDSFITLSASGLTATIVIQYGLLQQNFPSGGNLKVTANIVCYGLDIPPGTGWTHDPEMNTWSYVTTYTIMLLREADLPEVGDFIVVLSPNGGSYFNYWQTIAKVIYNSGEGYSEQMPSGGTLQLTATGGANNGVTIANDCASCTRNGNNSEITVTATATRGEVTKVVTGTFRFNAEVQLADANAVPFVANAGINIAGLVCGPCLAGDAETVEYFYETNVPYPGYTSAIIYMGDEQDTQYRYVAISVAVSFSKHNVSFPDPNIILPSNKGTIAASIGPSLNLSDMASAAITVSIPYAKEVRRKYETQWETVYNGTVIASSIDTAMRYYICATYKCKCGLESRKTGLKYICDHNNTKNRDNPYPDESVKPDYATSNSDPHEAFNVNWSFLPSGIRAELVNVTSQPDQTSFAHRIFPDNVNPEWTTHYSSDVMGCNTCGAAIGGFEFRLFSELIDKISSECGNINIEVRPIEAEVDSNGVFSYASTTNTGDIHSLNKTYHWSPSYSNHKIAYVEMSPLVYYPDASRDEYITDPRGNDVNSSKQFGLCFSEFLLSVDFSENLKDDYFRSIDSISESPKIDTQILEHTQDYGTVYPQKTSKWLGKWICVSKPDSANARFVYRKQTDVDSWSYHNLDCSDMLGRSKVLFWTDTVGQYDFEFRIYHNYEATPVIIERIRVNVIRCNIIGDYNRSGEICNDLEDDPAGEKECMVIKYYQENTKNLGIVVLVNCDDDDGNDICDCMDVTVAKPTIVVDENDLSPLCIQMPNGAELNGQLEYFEISVTTPENDACKIQANERIRIFDKDGTELIGPNTTSNVRFTSSQLDRLFNDTLSMNYKMEGLIFGAQVIVTIREKWRQHEEKTDSIRVLCCPFIATPNTNQVFSNSEIIVGCDGEPGTNREYGDPFCMINMEFPGINGMYDNQYCPERFPQDCFLFGFQSAVIRREGIETRYVTLKLKTSDICAYPNGDICYYYIRMSGNTVIGENGITAENTLDIGGAIEVFPENTGKPFGIMLLSKYGGERSRLIEFFQRQDVQFPTEVDLSCLDANHVDEVICILPKGSGSGAVILVGDSGKSSVHGAIKYLDTWINDNDNNTPNVDTIFPFSTYGNCHTYGDVYAFYHDENGNILTEYEGMISRLNSIDTQISNLGYTTVRVPVLYRKAVTVNFRRITYLSENACNSLPVVGVGNTKIALFVPYILYLENTDGVFTEAVKNIICDFGSPNPICGYQRSQVRNVESFYYFFACGQLHCGTNTRNKAWVFSFGGN